MSEETESQVLKPLKITCTSADCPNNLHCFLKTTKLVAIGKKGYCRYCNADLVNWERVHRRSVADVRYTFDALRLEMIRHHFWHTPFTERALNHARRKGKRALRAFAEKQLRTLVGSARHAREGYQTPRETSPHANVVHFAQHATASCCRKCIAEWHGISEGRVLTNEELAYLTELVMLYVSDRIPEMSDEAERIPPIRKTNRTHHERYPDEHRTSGHAN